MRKYVAGVITVALLSFAGVASAQETPAGMDTERSSVTGLSVWGILGYAGGVGAGARFAFPVGDGVLGNANTNLDIYDQFAVELGGDVVFWSWGGYSEMSIVPTAGFMWVFWLLDGKLGLYPKIDAYYSIVTTNLAGYTGAWSGFGIAGSGGIIYKTGNLSLRAEGGNVGLKLGLALNF